MRIIKPSFKILPPLPCGQMILSTLERAGRTCYKSEDKITPESASKFVKFLLGRGHESVIEHISVSVRIICDRGVSHEIVRHRLASYSQESTRYCRHGGDSGVIFIKPCFLEEGTINFNWWKRHMERCEDVYLRMLTWGNSPQEARSVLPNSLKTEIVMTCNLREWRHFFKLRTSRAAHPQMREIAIPMLKAFKKRIPVIFEDITHEQV